MYNLSMNIYDFDNTIYDGESFYDFFIEYIKVNPAFIRYLPKVIIAFAKYKLGKVTTQQMMDDYAPIISNEIIILGKVVSLIRYF